MRRPHACRHTLVDVSSLSSGTVTSSSARFQHAVFSGSQKWTLHILKSTRGCVAPCWVRGHQSRDHMLALWRQFVTSSQGRANPRLMKSYFPPSMELCGPKPVAERRHWKKEQKEKERDCTTSRKTRCKPTSRPVNPQCVNLTQFQPEDFFYQMSELSSLLVSGTKVLFRWSSGFFPSVLLWETCRNTARPFNTNFTAAVTYCTIQV